MIICFCFNLQPTVMSVCLLFFLSRAVVSPFMLYVIASTSCLSSFRGAWISYFSLRLWYQQCAAELQSLLYDTQRPSSQTSNSFDAVQSPATIRDVSCARSAFRYLCAPPPLKISAARPSSLWFLHPENSAPTRQLPPLLSTLRRQTWRSNREDEVRFAQVLSQSPLSPRQSFLAHE